MIAQVIYGFLTLGLCWVLACRIDKMNKGVTQTAVFLQHFLLGVSVFAAWLMSFGEYAIWGEVVLVAGVLQFFMFSLKRWRKHAPDSTMKPLDEIPAEQLKHVVGGRK